MRERGREGVRLRRLQEWGTRHSTRKSVRSVSGDCPEADKGQRCSPAVPGALPLRLGSGQEEAAWDVLGVGKTRGSCGLTQDMAALIFQTAARAQQQGHRENARAPRGAPPPPGGPRRGGESRLTAQPHGGGRARRQEDAGVVEPAHVTERPGDPPGGTVAQAPPPPPGGGAVRARALAHRRAEPPSPWSSARQAGRQAQESRPPPALARSPDEARQPMAARPGGRG